MILSILVSAPRHCPHPAAQTQAPRKSPDTVSWALLLAVVTGLTLSACAGQQATTGGSAPSQALQRPGVDAGVQPPSVQRRGRTDRAGAYTSGPQTAGSNVFARLQNTLTERDEGLMLDATQSALEENAAGQMMAWRNEVSGHRGTVVPQPLYENPEGQRCREYQRTVEVGGITETTYNAACRRDDGIWFDGDG